MKKIIILLFMMLCPIMVNAEDLGISASSSILVEESTGNVLYENNADEKRAPASMTKIMTLLLIMENIDSGKIKLSNKITISASAASMGGSQVFLQANSEIKVNELLKAITIASANDAAVAMSEVIGGTEEGFVKIMNSRAKELGCNNTNFVNAHGLDADNHYTTARDMSLMALALLKHKNVLKYTSIYEEYLNKPDGTSTWMVNTNKLIKYYNGLDGLKTGFTKSAGYCLTATAVRNDMRLISVVMNEPSTEVRSNDTIKLLNYGFSNYKVKTIVDINKDLGEIIVLNGKKEKVHIKLLENASNLEKINESKTYTYNIKTNSIKAPVKVGDKVGYLEIIENNKVIKKIDITVKENINKANIWDLYKRNLNKVLVGA